jgi:hypothetical protein
VDEVIRTVLWSAPLSAVLVSALVWLLRGWIAERLRSAVRHEYNKDLEEHKAKLKAQFDTELEVRRAALKAASDAELEVHKANAARLIHIDKAHFDMEFTSFQKLWTAASDTVDKTVQALRLYSFDELPEGEGEKRRYAEVADESFFQAIQVTQQLRPFIPRQIHELARALVADCKEQIDQFFRDIKLEKARNPHYDQLLAGKAAKQSIERVVDRWHELADAIQGRLQAIASEQTKHS